MSQLKQTNHIPVTKTIVKTWLGKYSQGFNLATSYFSPGKTLISRTFVIAQSKTNISKVVEKSKRDKRVKTLNGNYLPTNFQSGLTLDCSLLGSKQPVTWLIKMAHWVPNYNWKNNANKSFGNDSKRTPFFVLLQPSFLKEAPSDAIPIARLYGVQDAINGRDSLYQQTNLWCLTIYMTLR